MMTRLGTILRNRILTPWALPAVILLFCVGVFFLLDLMYPFPADALKRPSSILVEDGDGEVLRGFLAVDQQWRFPVKLQDLPDELIESVLASEDQWFYWHPGVNPFAILRAAVANTKEGTVVSGASTLPMQIARITDPKPRTYWSKCKEAFRALQLELRFSKTEQLEFYFNLAPYGGNIEGVGAAARFYFGKEPAHLSLGEVALLTVLPRSPSGYDPVRAPALATAVRNRWLDTLKLRGTFTEEQIEQAKSEPVPRQRRSLPFEAPHFSYYMADRMPGAARIKTTIEQRAQKIVEKQIAAQIGPLRDQGIGNAAAVVIENDSRSLRALVGSAGFFEVAFEGQVNGATSPRSPGSALKPFLFARAMDQGRILPGTYLLDIPTDFAGYVPENYDGEYRGRVTAAESLRLSLNAPAVRLLAEEGVPGFLQLLQTGGLSTLNRPAQEYGLPLILGGCGVTLLDLTNLYCGLARGGTWAPVRMLRDEEAPAEQRLFSREAAYLITRNLTMLERPDLPQAWQLARGIPEVAWKTGTSYGHRDAWAIGFSNRYTIGVWVGNFDGHAIDGISGARHAAPVLFSLFRALELDGARLEEPAGLNISKVEVCSLSHELPGPFCPERTEITFLPGRSRLKRCSYHRRAFIDVKTGEQLAGQLLSKRDYREEILTIYPSDLVAWWRTEKRLVPQVPAVAQNSPLAPAGERPEILSPQDEGRYLWWKDAVEGHQKIALSARTSQDTRQLYWYQDGVLRYTAAPGDEVFLELEPGQHRLVVVNDLGLSDSVVYYAEGNSLD